MAPDDLHDHKLTEHAQSFREGSIMLAVMARKAEQPAGTESEHLAHLADDVVGAGQAQDVDEDNASDDHDVTEEGA